MEQEFSISYCNLSNLRELVNQSFLSGVLGALWFSQRENHAIALFPTLASKRGAHAEGGPLGVGLAEVLGKTTRRVEWTLPAIASFWRSSTLWWFILWRS